MSTLNIPIWNETEKKLKQIYFHYFVKLDHKIWQKNINDIKNLGHDEIINS